ncbi:hypothetical protein AMECASPLE_016564 [Ameca splendens]|uniref:Uncharacterized protein n=1 Tax=Ameca splendens TaxID=208324 RepID=A0ABV0XR43_9TELE
MLLEKYVCHLTAVCDQVGEKHENQLPGWYSSSSSSRWSPMHSLPTERHSPFSVYWAIPCASSWWDVPGTLPGEASRRHLVQMPEPPQLHLSMWWSSGSTLSSSWMAKLLTLSLRECPNTLLRKFISATFIQDLVLSVMTQVS